MGVVIIVLCRISLVSQIHFLSCTKRTAMVPSHWYTGLRCVVYRGEWEGKGGEGLVCTCTCRCYMCFNRELEMLKLHYYVLFTCNYGF